jgi:hypothetical protein
MGIVNLAFDWVLLVAALDELGLIAAIAFQFLSGFASTTHAGVARLIALVFPTWQVVPTYLSTAPPTLIGGIDTAFLHRISTTVTCLDRSH